MRSATGRWVSGADFFNREPELRIPGEPGMEMLAEAATQGVLTAGARVRLGELYSRVVGDAPARITEILDLLVHDGYLEAAGEDHGFPSRLLKDWWAARFRAHHVPIADRSSDAVEERSR